MNLPKDTGNGNVSLTAGAANFQDSVKEKIAEKPEISLQFSKIDVWFFFFSLLCGYCFVWLVAPFSLGFGVTVFTVLFFLLAFGYFRAAGICPPKESYWWLGVSLLSGINFSLFDQELLKFFNLLFLMACVVYWIADCTETRLEKKLGSFFTADLVNQFFRVPFLNFGCGFSILGKTAAKSKGSRTLISVFVGILVAIPLLLVVISLLISADTTFEGLVLKISDKISDQASRFVARLVPAILVGCYFFGLLFGNIKKRRVDTVTAEVVEKRREKRKMIPSTGVITLNILFCAVYFVFLGAQVVTLVSALQKMQPIGVSYAEFARRGFFELCLVAFINLAIIGGSKVFSKRDGKVQENFLKILTVLLSGQTMLLIVTALGKMWLYIGRYGMTRLRIYTSWFMVFLFLVFVFLLLSQFKKFNLSKCVVVMGSILFLLLCYSDTDTMIVRYNIERYQSGSLESLDIGEFYSMETAAIPEAIRLYAAEEDPGVRKELEEFLSDRQDWYREKIFEENNLQRLKARQMLDELVISGDRIIDPR